MKVRIVKASLNTYWYSNKIGEEFVVWDYNETDYVVDGNFHKEYAAVKFAIKKEDCEIIQSEIDPVYFVYNPSGSAPQKKYKGSKGLDTAREHIKHMLNRESGKFYILQIKEIYRSEIKIVTEKLY